MLQEASDEPFYRYTDSNIVFTRVEEAGNIGYLSGMNNVVTGLVSGLVIAVVLLLLGLWLASKASLKKKDKEIQKYKNMLAERMELETDGIAKIRSENEELKKANENLRVSLLAFRDKPGRKEMEMLQIMQKAVERLSLNSPGFAPAWQAAMKESEEEFKKVYSGFLPFIKRHIAKPTDAEVIDVDEGN